MHLVQETSWPEYSETLAYPLAFTWTSDVPLIGSGIEVLKKEVEQLDEKNEVLVVHGFYFRDEKEDLDQLQQLALSRIDHVLEYLNIDRQRIIKVIGDQPVNGDVRSNPFEAIRFERYQTSSLLNAGLDTFEICFPIKDSLVIPIILTDQFLEWMGRPSKQKDAIIHITGTADGGGIVESSEIALERALYIETLLLNEGWEKEQIQISSGQRNHPLALRNRCVVVFFE